MTPRYVPEALGGEGSARVTWVKPRSAERKLRLGYSFAAGCTCTRVVGNDQKQTGPDTCKKSGKKKRTRAYVVGLLLHETTYEARRTL